MSPRDHQRFGLPFRAPLIHFMSFPMIICRALVPGSGRVGHGPKGAASPPPPHGPGIFSSWGRAFLWAVGDRTIAGSYRAAGGQPPSARYSRSSFVRGMNSTYPRNEFGSRPTALSDTRRRS